MQVQGEVEDSIQEARNAEEKAKKAITDVRPVLTASFKTNEQVQDWSSKLSASDISVVTPWF